MCVIMKDKKNQLYSKHYNVNKKLLDIFLAKRLPQNHKYGFKEALQIL